MFLAGCTSSEIVTESPSTPDPEQAAAVEHDEIAALLDVYRDRYKETMGVEIARVTESLRFDQPGNPLGNLAADAIRFRAAREARSLVHLAFIGQDSFRLTFDEGPLTLGEVYEFMPYENHLVVLTVTGHDVKTLASHIAQNGGAPFSGMRFRNQNGEPAGILVQSEPLQAERSYRLATTSYYANGGGGYLSSFSPVDRQDFFDVSIRELYVEFFRLRRTIEPVLDGRMQ
ncbi:MAG: 5'-nucleotidase C-terminal domain-containing protein [Balneolaceae bacterium]